MEEFAMSKKTRLFFIILILAFASACGSQPTQTEIPTPEFIPVIVTVEMLVPVTVTPTESLTIDPVTEPTQIPTSGTQTLKLEDIEEDGQSWKVYKEGDSLWTLQNLDTPSLNGKSLQCSIAGGSPYSNVHCYTEFVPIPKANAFKLELSFRFTPATACNNEGTSSVVQAVEFTMSKWEQSRRYEFALQWQNVGNGAPQWRYWDPSKPAGEQWVPVNSNIKFCVKSDEWHTLSLDGDIVNDQVHYKKFAIDNFISNLDVTLPPASTPNEKDRLTVAVQVDGNFIQTPYDLFIDNVSFTVEKNFNCNDVAALMQNTDFTFQGNSDFMPKDDDPNTSVFIVEKNAKVTWDPICLMDLQYYQYGTAIITNKDASSGQYDFNDEQIEVGVDTEIKIWRGGEIIKNLWVRVRE
jgi:hypothetical protein